MTRRGKSGAGRARPIPVPAPSGRLQPVVQLRPPRDGAPRPTSNSGVPSKSPPNWSSGEKGESCHRLTADVLSDPILPKPESILAVPGYRRVGWEEPAQCEGTGPAPGASSAGAPGERAR